MKLYRYIFIGTIILALVFLESFNASGITLNLGPRPLSHPLVSRIMHSNLFVGVYLIPLILVWGFYMGVRMFRNSRNLSLLRETVNAGMAEPATLHPVINHNRCMGCGSCINACPEQAGHHVLGIINGKCHLIGPAHCIGHGACADSCPQDAITLVFGSENRGVDIPEVRENFETNVPGIFIAGELGGKGLIKNAIEQGKAALESIYKSVSRGNDEYLDVVIVGAGPAGFAATLAAHEKQMRYVTIEQEQLGGTVSTFPKGKVVMTAPVNMPIAGQVNFRETTKETLLEFWQDVEKSSGIIINYREKLEKIVAIAEGFEVRTGKAVYKTKSVLLALGRRGTPRKLGVEGEDHEKVIYNLVDPAEYRGKKVLVVGGGDSALEAAVCIAAEDGSMVCLSYRSEAFTRAKEKNRKKVEKAVGTGKLQVILKSNVQKVSSSHVELEHEGNIRRLENDTVIVCAGGILPIPMLKDTGINVETKYGTP